MSNYLLIFSLILYSVLSPGQSAPSWPGSCYQGYSASLKGGGFSYHSPQPDVTTSMLIRATDSSQYIEWQTESLPAELKESTARFIWMFGIDANPQSYRWNLCINDTCVLTFVNPIRSGWKNR